MILPIGRTPMMRVLVMVQTAWYTGEDLLMSSVNKYFQVRQPGPRSTRTIQISCIVQGVPQNWAHNSYQNAAIGKTIFEILMRRVFNRGQELYDSAFKQELCPFYNLKQNVPSFAGHSEFRIQKCMYWDLGYRIQDSGFHKRTFIRILCFFYLETQIFVSCS